MIGTWIDSLSDAQKDRIVKAPGWITDFYYDDNAPENKCLLGHVYALEASDVPPLVWTDDGDLICVNLFLRFDRLCHRFGLDRIVRACKLRAASTMSSEVERAGEVVHG